MLRGPQTPGELKQRTERLHAFAGLAAVEETLDKLVERELAARHRRRPGQKEERYSQLLGGEGSAAVPGTLVAAGQAAEADRPAVRPSPSEEEDRLDRLERELATLREQVAKLREALGED